MWPWRSVWLWERWVFAMKNREEQENAWLLGFLCLFPKKIYRFMGLLEIGLFTGFMSLICWRIQC